MAVELMGRIMARPREEVDASEKWVLVVMADRADDDGLLWYANDTIAEKTSYTPRAVQKIIDRLIAKRLVKKQHRRNRSNYYVINVDRFPAVERTKRTKEAGPIEFMAELDAEPTLFGGSGSGAITGEPGSTTGERRSVTGERRSVTGEPGSPDSLIDSLNDSLMESPLPPLGERVVGLWNELAAQHDRLPAVSALNDARRRGIELRAAEFAERHGAADDPQLWVWIDAIRTVGTSKLLTGLSTDWHASFDWVLKRANFLKIMEGNYGRGKDVIGAASTGPGTRSAAEAGSEARRLVERARERGRTDTARP